MNLKELIKELQALRGYYEDKSEVLFSDLYGNLFEIHCTAEHESKIQIIGQPVKEGVK